MTRRPKKEPEEPDGEPIPPARLDFAKKLVALRRTVGLTQVQLSEASGIRQSHISALENAAWEPRLVTILALCKALHISPTELLPSVESTDDSSQSNT